MAQGEGDFLLAKIDWATNDATSFEIVNPSLLKINALVTIIFKENNGNLEINGVPLNNSTAQVKNLKFETGENSGFNASFTLQARTAAGKTFSQDFNEKYHLKK